MHKRKYRKLAPDGWEQPDLGSYSTITHVQPVSSTRGGNVDVPPAFDPTLYIQAHEADIIRGPQGVAAAHSLECSEAFTTDEPKLRPGLIRWGAPERPLTLDTDAGSYDAHELKQSPLWVDRYDVRLLLESLPEPDAEHSQVRPISPSGWSDLPSDSEDTFFFSPDEVEDYRRKKRRRLIDRGREERLKALAAEEGEEGSDPWGGSDEEPDETQRDLIRRTASHIISSPNPAQLEMRILANHGVDKRFAFLRGRWSRAWRMEKERVRQQRAEEDEAKEARTSLGGLVAYGDSDNGSEESADKTAAEETAGASISQGPCDEEALKGARRARAREWAARRRAEQTSRQDQV
ncbi:hypothetical protein PAXRUDRAFT_331592 [Paxillus rubicundulus Ve08.2h10]|uniref:Uncharacterized protein n=1 Tax=Paxillus rubicundulus Ve08.2h10 TaxID=930991 RepID=A0A0D0DXA7_9AGAM|nr:hypothetical protein PAXRUDRAFT_331592 [Paxillus rubicundulus Ve08.2h10]